MIRKLEIALSSMQTLTYVNGKSITIFPSSGEPQIQSVQFQIERLASPILFQNKHFLL